jgi:carbon-monoxide dehydrogenase large subunit
MHILRYVAMQDSGGSSTPIADGQARRHRARHRYAFEWMGYDENGQPITTTFGDYLLPTATELPNIESSRTRRARRSIRWG